VIKGEKWVISAWIRDGVSDHNSWQNYDATGNALDKEEFLDSLNSKQVRFVESAVDDTFL
jgi:hypothetical protein